MTTQNFARSIGCVLADGQRSRFVFPSKTDYVNNPAGIAAHKPSGKGKIHAVVLHAWQLKMIAKYTRRAEDSGWLSVRLSASGQLAALCEYTRVEIERETEGRTFFKIADGNINVGDEASLTTANAAKYLSDVGPGGAAKVLVTYRGAPTEAVSMFKGRLKQQWANLSFDGQTANVTLNSVWAGRFSPIPRGTHSILTPDYSHKQISTEGYAAATPGMVGNDVWFPIGINASLQNSSRYIHVGNLSEGCVTIYQLERWSALYTYLISHRIPGSAGRRVGSLVVHA